MVLAMVRILVTQRAQEQVMSVLTWLVGPTSAQPGCLRCSLCRDAIYDGRLLFITEWRTQADFDRYLESDQFGFILAAMESATGAPEVTFHTISETRGMEHVAAVRQNGDKEAGLAVGEGRDKRQQPRQGGGACREPFRAVSAYRGPGCGGRRKGAIADEGTAGPRRTARRKPRQQS